jgi:hypothetical protein
MLTEARDFLLSLVQGKSKGKLTFVEYLGVGLGLP